MSDMSSMDNMDSMNDAGSMSSTSNAGSNMPRIPRTRIITDSASDLLAGEMPGVAVVPLVVTFGTTEYRDGVDIAHSEFYEKLVESDELPRTSQPSPYAFKQAIDAVLAEEGEGAEVVIVCLSSKLSGTYESALAAAQEYGSCVRVVDSKSVAVGEKALVKLAADLAAAGASAQEIEARLDSEKERLRVVALLDTLEYLRRGGRISKAVAFAGGMLSVKPVIALEEGEVALLGQARGSRKGNNLLMEEVRKAGGIDFEKPFYLGYTGLSDSLMKKYIQDSRSLWEGHAESVDYSSIGATIGTHAGPGAVALAFFAKDGQGETAGE